MRHGASGRRQRNRGGGRRGNHQNRSYVFDSNGPDVRIRGTAHQIYEKYVALAKDAAGVGDRIVEQNYLQHAEHYLRIINSWDEEMRSGHRPPPMVDFDREEEGAAPQNANFSRPAEQQQAAAQQAPGAPAQAAKRPDDLGLPASILGGGVRKETQFEDA